MTLPTKLTLLRILLAFFVMGLLFIPGWPAKTAALLGFLAAGATDWLDGYLARRLGQATPMGALLDPIADKVLVLGIFLAFVQLRLIPAWMVLIIVLRESFITGAQVRTSEDVVPVPAPTSRQLQPEPTPRRSKSPSVMSRQTRAWKARRLTSKEESPRM